MRVRFSRNGLSPERARSTRSWVGAALGCACILTGCTRTNATAMTEQAPPVRGVGAGTSKTVPHIAAGVATRSDNSDAPAARTDSADAVGMGQGLGLGEPAVADPSAAAEQPTTEPSAPAEAPKARDYRAELAQLVGDPSGCLEPRLSDGTLQPIQLVVRSQVMPSGAVARAEVSSPALRSSEQRCIAHRVESVHFAPPIEGAPIGVETSVWLRPSAPAPAAAATPQPTAAAAPTAATSPEDTAIPPPLAAIEPSTEEVVPQPIAAAPVNTEGVARQPSYGDGTAPAD